APAIPVDTSLMQSLIGAGAAQKDFTGLINADLLAGLIKQSQTTAESARADALKRATELQSQAMTEVGNFFGAKGGEAYAANYRDSGSAGGASATPVSSSAQPSSSQASSPPAPQPAKPPAKPPAQPPKAPGSP